ncbi:DUF5040 domain-containing protein [Myroides sp.]|uniref:DUF5040 domain-containing protein n=1 Tax=Myroides sp. TaxID=1874736 RepID=UPI0028B02D97|nr:DUF5040 domain-containing protein [Myroides sp.]
MSNPKLATEAQVQGVSDTFIEIINHQGKQIKALESGVIDAIEPSSPAPTKRGEYKVTKPGVFLNFKDANGQPISVTQEDYSKGNVSIIFNGVDCRVLIVPITFEGEVKEGDTRGVSGGEVFNNLKNNIINVENFSKIGTIDFKTGNINSDNSNFKHNPPLLLKKGEKAFFGVNVVRNINSSSALLAIYDTHGNFIKTEIYIKNITNNMFYEGEYINSIEDCLIVVVNNTTLSISKPYLSKKIFLTPEEISTSFDTKGNKIVSETLLTEVITEEYDTDINVNSTIVGYAYLDDRFNNTTNTFKRTDYILLPAGGKVSFGINTGTNLKSEAAILNIYDLEKKYIRTEYRMLDYFSQFTELEFSAKEICYVVISENVKDKFSEKEPYITVKYRDELIKKSNFQLFTKSNSEDKPIVAHQVTPVKSGNKIIISGTSFSYSSNGWFELACDKLGIEGINKSYSGERINNFMNRINNETFFSQEILNTCDALIIMHTHNKDVTLQDTVINGVKYTSSQLEEFTSNDYDSLNWDKVNSTTGWDGTDSEFAAMWDYCLKKIQTIYYNEKDNPSSVYYNTKSGKPFNVVITTNWHDGRVVFNNSVRKLCLKWGIPLIQFDESIGFTRKTKHSVTREQHSLLYALDTEVIDGEKFAWHYVRGQEEHIPKRLSSIAISSFKVI